eukprot:NODE_776_length_3975_cov_0.468008.p4 type:complete len:207 gc:universal NODE_776_length_3975_cov_0.468008:1604-2224(+)
MSLPNAWLVKIPKFLLEEFNNQQNGKNLGELKLEGKQGTLEIEHPELPLKYTLKITNPKAENMISFNESGAKVNIVTECTLQPELDERYRHIMKKRKLASQSQRQSEFRDKEIKQTYERDGFSKETKKGMRKDDEKRIRLPEKQVIDLLFRLFERSEYASMKSLVEQTDQSASYLKEVLPKIAELIKRGPYNSMWTLKNEYKRLKQ